MKKLYIDCTNGVCSDMVLSALLGLGMDVDCEAKHELEHTLNIEHSHHHDHHHDHHHHEHSHRSYKEICKIINEAPISPNAKATALEIYSVIAHAEAFVHETTMEEVHFHEVGRPEAILNIISIAVCLDATGADEILCSDIHDGKGVIECSHGIIPVPVPAVMAIRDDERTKALGYTYVTEEVETELVTPSGLGILVGIGAKQAEYPQGSVIARATGYGTRDTGRGGLEITLIEE